jgi:hypothetical protein
MRKATITTTIAAAAIGVALATAPLSHASPSVEAEFLYDLNQFGISIYDTGAALGTGYAICAARNTTPELTVVDNLYRNTSFADVPNYETAMVWVAAAEVNLCPQHANAGPTTVA